MIYLSTILIIALSSFLWRVRGGLDIWKGGNVPMNKIWYAVAFSIYSGFYYGWGIEEQLIAFIVCYASYQLFGWGLYVGTLVGDGHKIDPEKDKECELIDDLIMPLHITLKGQKYYLYQYPKLFGFVGTSLTGLIISFLWGVYMINFFVMLSGLAMGICYYLGDLLDKLIPDNKSGWNWGEVFAGIWFGFVLAWVLLW